MIHFKAFVSFTRSSSPLILVVKQNPSNQINEVSVRSFMTSFFKKPTKRETEFKDTEIKALTGIDDPNFTENLKNVIFKPNFKKTFKNFGSECHKFYKETRDRLESITNFRIDSKEGRVDILYTFETPEDLKKFSVHTDSSFLSGYSSAALRLSQIGTALFSGNICTDVPKDGNIKTAGYANFTSNLVSKAFFRYHVHDFSPYTHLVFKIRGDGRTYLVILSTKSKYEETKYFAYAHPLYTRGGPYWQIAKIPLSHFFRTNKGMVQMGQNRRKDLQEIKRFGITAAGFEGPFQLEIDYIGLEFVETHKTICPYESYKN